MLAPATMAGLTTRAKDDNSGPYVLIEQTGGPLGDSARVTVLLDCPVRWTEWLPAGLSLWEGSAPNNSPRTTTP